MYSKKQSMKEQGFSIRQVSKIIRVSRNTIKKYWDMSPDEYAAALTAVNKLSSLMGYEPSVLNWLQAYPCMTSAQLAHGYAQVVCHLLHCFAASAT